MKTKKFKLGIFLGMLFMLLVGTVQAFAVDAIPMEWGRGYTVRPTSVKDGTRYFTFKLDSPAKVRIFGTIHEEIRKDLGGLEVWLDPTDDRLFSGTRVVDYFLGKPRIADTEIVLNKGTHTLKVVQDGLREYSVCVGLRESYQEGPATKITLPKSATVTKGIKYTLKPELVNSYETLTGMKWSTSKKSIATVDQKGVVTPKKKGTCYISCKLKNGTTYKCKVTVKDNVWTGRSYSKIEVSDYYYKQEVQLEPVKVYYSGNKLKLECAAINNRMFKAKYFKWIEITLRTSDGQVIAKHKFGKTKLNIKKYEKKKLTFTFPAKKVKKKSCDLRNEKKIYMYSDYYYYWQY